MQINHSQAQALIEILQDNIDGEAVLFTEQGDGSLIVAFNLATFSIATSGEAEEIAMMATTIQPRVYAACLAAYNNGILHGEWIDADQDVDDIHAEIQAMLKRSPIKGAEEWAFHDHEYMGQISEYESVEHVSEIGAGGR